MSKDESEQWMLDGDCRKCRRAKYCSKLCRLCRISKINFEREIHDYILRKTGMGKIMNVIKDAQQGGNL